MSWWPVKGWVGFRGRGFFCGEEIYRALGYGKGGGTWIEAELDVLGRIVLVLGVSVGGGRGVGETASAGLEEACADGGMRRWRLP